MTSRMLSFVGLLAVSGCVFRVGPPVEYRAPPQRVVVMSPMSRDEAIASGMSYAQSRGYSARPRSATLSGNRVWKVRIEVVRGDARGHLKLEFDATSRVLLRADERLHGHHDRHGDRDDDDEVRGNEHRAVPVH